MDNVQKKPKTLDDLLFERTFKFCPIINSLCKGSECLALYIHEWGNMEPTVCCKIIDGLGAIYSTSCGQEL